MSVLQDAEAVFQNNEEVRIIPIYRDPVHDFGFFQYDPSVRLRRSLSTGLVTRDLRPHCLLASDLAHLVARAPHLRAVAAAVS